MVAIVRQRCPVCLDGEVFHAIFHMLPACQVCGHRFERGPGFYRGAMYASYAFGLVLFVTIAGAAVRWLAPPLGLSFALVVAGLLYVLLVPWIFRYPRVLWAHLAPPLPERRPRLVRVPD